MCWNRLAGNWKQLKGSVKQQWGKFTDDQFYVMAGTRDLLAGIIQESKALSRQEAEKRYASMINGKST